MIICAASLLSFRYFPSNLRITLAGFMNNIQQLSHESANELSAVRMHSPELQANVRSTYYNSCITKFLRTHFYSQVQELSLI